MPPRTPTDRSLQLEPHPGHDCAQCQGPLIPTALRWRCSECGAYDGDAVFSPQDAQEAPQQGDAAHASDPV